MYKRLYSVLEKKRKKNSLHSFQFGFQKYYSTTHALHHLTDKIRNEIDKNY